KYPPPSRRKPVAGTCCPLTNYASSDSERLGSPRAADGDGRPFNIDAEASPVLSRNEAILTSDVPQTSLILASLGQAAFAWDIVTDAMVWTDHVGAVFTDIPPGQLSSGTEFAKLIEPERSIRADVLLQSPPAHGE